MTRPAPTPGFKRAYHEWNRPRDPAPELVRCSCGVRMKLDDAAGHEARNPTHVVLRQVSR
jgi:hypothetical protein